MARKLKLGFFLPIEEGFFAGGTAGWQDMAGLAQRIDELGFDSVWLADHVIFGEPDSERYRGAWESLSFMAGLAAVTKNVEIGNLVACTQFRNPALLAKMADTMDEMSGGRIVLGIGAGWNKEEFEAFGWPFDHRVSRFEEALLIIHSMYHNRFTTFDGDYYQVKDAELKPRGPRPNGPPILIGSTGVRMLDLTARYADRWNVEWWNLVEGDMAGMLARVDAACEAVGRDPKTLERSLFFRLDIGGGWSAKGVESVTGDAQAQADFLNRVAETGFDEVQIWLDKNTVEGVEEFAKVAELID